MPPKMIFWTIVIVVLFGLKHFLIERHFKKKFTTLPLEAIGDLRSSFVFFQLAGSAVLCTVLGFPFSWAIKILIIEMIIQAVFFMLGARAYKKALAAHGLGTTPSAKSAAKIPFLIVYFAFLFWVANLYQSFAPF